TKITAPFNTVINTREADLGEAVTPATKLATLAGTDAYWIEVLMPVRQLRWIEVPGLNGEKGASIKVYDPASWGKTRFRTGQVIRLAGTLEAEGRMARLLVSVPDPLGLTADHGESDFPVLLMGAFVRVEIEGRSLNHVAAIRREWLRDGDTVWLMNKQNALEIRPIQIAYRGRGQVFASGGLREGERVVVTDLATPVEGMPLRTGEEAGQNASPPQAPISRDTGTP
ncbi:MAG: efflux RND transporter periplasmic adaptor subunit, partial [Nitrospiria bacterium]